MTVANLEKLCKLIKNINDNLPLPTPPSSKVKGIFAQKTSPDCRCYFLQGQEETKEQPWRKVSYRFSFLLPQVFHFYVEIALSSKSK